MVIFFGKMSVEIQNTVFCFFSVKNAPHCVQLFDYSLFFYYSLLSHLHSK